MVRCGVVVVEVDEVMLVLCDMAPVLRAALRCVPQFRVSNTLFSGWGWEEQLSSYGRRIKIKHPNSTNIFYKMHSFLFFSHQFILVNIFVFKRLSFSKWPLCLLKFIFSLLCMNIKQCLLLCLYIRFISKVQRIRE